MAAATAAGGGAANVRVSHRDAMLHAARLKVQFAPETEQSWTDAELEFKVRAGISVQDIRNRAGGACTRLPRQRVRVRFYQAAFLKVAPAIEISVIEFAFFSGWRPHRSWFPTSLT